MITKGLSCMKKSMKITMICFVSYDVRACRHNIESLTTKQERAPVSARRQPAHRIRQNIKNERKI